MSDEVLADCECPICLETLQPPIRMLPCGHNFCQACLEGLSSSSSTLRCPNCRQSCQLGSPGVNTLSRNFTLENLIENIKKVNFKPKTAQVATANIVMSGDALDQLTRLSTSLIDEENYEEALQTLQTIIIHGDTINKLQALMNKILCLVEINNEDDAFVCAAEILSLVESDISTSVMKNAAEKLHQNLESLIKKLNEKKKVNSGQLLLKCLLDLTNHFLLGKDRLLKLQTIGNLFKVEFLELITQKKSFESEEYFSFMNELLKSMQTTTDVDWYLKCRTVTLFLQKCGLCCNKMRNWPRSIEYNMQAIGLFETAFPEEATKIQTLGHCYNNVGAAFENQNDLYKAKQCFEKAISLHKNATFNTEKARQESINTAQRNLDRIMKKI